MDKRTLYSGQVIGDNDTALNSAEITLSGRACVAFLDVNENTATGSALSAAYARVLLLVPQAKDELSGNFVDLGTCTACGTLATVAVGLVRGAAAKTAVLANAYFAIAAPLPRVIRFTVSHPDTSASTEATFSLGVQIDRALSSAGP